MSVFTHKLDWEHIINLSRKRASDAPTAGPSETLHISTQAGAPDP